METPPLCTHTWFGRPASTRVLITLSRFPLDVAGTGAGCDGTDLD
jgi:hypothetical protein